MDLHLYPDSNFFQRLTKRGNEHHWNEFIDACETHKIDLPKGCYPIFTSFLILERIGLGGVLKPLQSGQAYKSLVKLIQGYIKGMPDPKNLSPSDLLKCQCEIADLLDGMGEIFLSLLRQLPTLEINSFLEQLDHEISIHATNAAAGELIQATLKRLQESFVSQPVDCLAVLVGQLAWNLMATFPFIEPDQISKDEAMSMFSKAEMWFDVLFAAFHKAYLDDMRVGFFRLAENRYHTYAKILAKDLNNSQFARAKAWLDRYKPLRRKDDLCDGELIDFAVLGIDGEIVICFTADVHTDIANRLGLLKGTLEDAAQAVEGWSIFPCWGCVYCISEKGKPLEIVHSFLCQEPLAPELEPVVPCLPI